MLVVPPDDGIVAKTLQTKVYRFRVLTPGRHDSMRIGHVARGRLRPTSVAAFRDAMCSFCNNPEAKKGRPQYATPTDISWQHAVAVAWTDVRFAAGHRSGRVIYWRTLGDQVNDIEHIAVAGHLRGSSTTSACRSAASTWPTNEGRSGVTLTAMAF